MADDVSYPSIDLSTFDLIVVGTGLPESIIAAASSAAGKSVLHLDPNTFYGSHYSSLPLEDFIYFLHSQQDLPLSMRSYSPSPVNVDDDYVVVDLKPSSLYSDIEISTSQISLEDLKPSRKFSLDLSGPRVLFCADSVMDQLLNSGASHHIEFKSVDASLVYTSDGEVINCAGFSFRDFQRSKSWIDREELVDEVFQACTGTFRIDNGTPILLFLPQHFDIGLL